MNQAQCRKLLRDISRSGIFHAPRQDMTGLLAAAEASGFSVHRIDLANVPDKDGLFERMASAFEFPEWFGHNWDALADCLGDLSWLHANGYLILLENVDGFRNRHGGDFATALQVFAAVAEAWRDARVPFWVLMDIHADGIANLPEIE